MSKIKKKPVVSSSAISELDTNFKKIIQFSGWLFLLGLLGFLGGWLVLDNVLNIINLNLDAIEFSIIIFIGTNSAISFALASKIKNNLDKKKQYFLDWLIAEYIFCMLAIFSIAAYQW
ncbi:MAG: hypothetical protein ACFE9S_05055 [Candidatus Hermodarchaeota archaeon]